MEVDKMPRGKKKDTRTLQEKLADLNVEITKQEAVLKDLKQQKKDLENAIEDEKREEVFRKIEASGRSIDDILALLNK